MLKTQGKAFDGLRVAVSGSGNVAQYATEKVNDFGKLQEVRVSSGIDPQKILVELLKKTRITRFEIAKPSLNDIFIRIASPEKKEDNHG